VGCVRRARPGARIAGIASLVSDPRRHSPRAPISQARRVAGIYAASALVWIVASDQVLAGAGVWVQTLKGTGFVAVTSAVLFVVILADERKREEAARALERAERDAAHAEDAERQRISEAIHDDPLQLVIALGMQLELLRRRSNDPDLDGTLDALVEQSQQASEHLRNVMFDLHPRGLEGAGLAHALADVLHRVEVLDDRLHGALADATSEPVPEGAGIVLYRSAREAILNVARHAHAEHLDVRIETVDGGTRVRVDDDGVGFPAHEPPPAGHLGLVSMRARVERAGGRVSVEAEPGDGTRVSLWVPHAVG
jgi:signal transduction histidine kinase